MFIINFNFRNFKFLYVISIQFQYVSNIIPIIGIGDELEMNWRRIGDMMLQR